MIKNKNDFITDATQEDAMLWLELRRYFYGRDVQGEYENMFKKECPYNIVTAQKIAEKAMDILDNNDDYWEIYFSAIQEAIRLFEEQNKTNN